MPTKVTATMLPTTMIGSYPKPRWFEDYNVGGADLLECKIIPNAFGERAVLKLMFGALIRAAERWRSVKVTEFERRQMAAVRKELDQEYEAVVGLNAKPSKDDAQIKLSSNSRT
jgi:hypothetical protein